VPDVPERVPQRPVAPDRSSQTESDGPSPARDKMLEALRTLSDFTNADLAHKKPCTGRGSCTCGLWGLQQYLGFR
jgi:hypothetical protein